MQKLKEMPKVVRSGRKPSHDYENIVKAALESPISLTRGDDFDCSVKTMKHNLYRQQGIFDVEINTSTLDPDNNKGKEGLAIKASKGYNPKKKTSTKK